MKDLIERQVGKMAACRADALERYITAFLAENPGYALRDLVLCERVDPVAGTMRYWLEPKDVSEARAWQ